VTLRIFRALACAVALACGACSSVPFAPGERPPLDGIDPESARRGFEATVPGSFELLSSVVFEFWGHKVSALGVVSVNGETGAYRLACITPVGMKLFEISGTPETSTCDFAVEGLFDRFARDDQFAEAVGADVRTIYLGLVPPADAEVERGERQFVYRSGDDARRTEHVLAGRDPMLVEKRTWVHGDVVSRVRFYEYTWHGGRAFPGGVVLDNERYGYRLVVRVKEIQN
jgi:hypothetical protein